MNNPFANAAAIGELIFAIILLWWSSMRALRANRVKPLFLFYLLSFILVYHVGLTFDTKGMTGQNLHLATIFVGSVAGIILLGILTTENVLAKKSRIKSLQINLIAVAILIETAFITGFLASISEDLFFLHILELVISLTTLIFGISVAIHYYDLLNKRLVFMTICFGIISISGVVMTAIFDNTLGGFLNSIGSSGVTVCLYFLVITSIILGRKLNDAKNN